MKSKMTYYESLLHLAFIIFILASFNNLAGDIGKLPTCSFEPYGWDHVFVPLAIFVVLYGAGYLAGRARSRGGDK